MLVRAPTLMVAVPASSVLLYQTLACSSATTWPRRAAVLPMKTEGWIWEPRRDGSRRLDAGLGEVGLAGHALAPSRHFAGAERPHRFGRAAGIEKPPGTRLLVEHRGARLEHGVVLHHGPIEDHYIVADDHIAADRARVHAGVAADRYAVPDDAGKDLVVDVQRRAGAQMEVVCRP